MKNFTIYRYEYSPDYTLGHFYNDKDYICDTLELPWLNNQPQVSCIPEGEYPISQFTSPHNGLCISVANVPKRSAIEIHSANQTSEIKGCIAVGVKSIDLVLRSKENLGIILKLLGNDKGLLTVKGMVLL